MTDKPALDTLPPPMKAAYGRYPELELRGLNPCEMVTFLEHGVALNSEYEHKSFVHKIMLSAATVIRDLLSDRPQPTPDDALPCVCCQKPSETATPDGADMCNACFGEFNATEYDNLRKRFVELIQRDYPHADIEEALDPCRPLPARTTPTKALDALAKLRSYFGKPVGITMQELGRDAYIDLSFKVRIGDLIDYDEALAALGQETRAP